MFELRVLVPTRLEVSVATPAEDLPGIWGIGETVRVILALTDDAGRGLAGKPVTVVVGDPNGPEEVADRRLGADRIGPELEQSLGSSRSRLSSRGTTHTFRRMGTANLRWSISGMT